MENTGYGQATHKCLSDTRSTYLTGDLLDGNCWWFYALAVAGKQKFEICVHCSWSNAPFNYITKL
jgi:hypothetical protein